MSDKEFANGVNIPCGDKDQDDSVNVTIQASHSDGTPCALQLYHIRELAAALQEILEMSEVDDE